MQSTKRIHAEKQLLQSGWKNVNNILRSYGRITLEMGHILEWLNAFEIYIYRVKVITWNILPYILPEVICAICENNPSRIVGTTERTRESRADGQAYRRTNGHGKYNIPPNFSEWGIKTSRLNAKNYHLLWGICVPDISITVVAFVTLI